MISEKYTNDVGTYFKYEPYSNTSILGWDAAKLWKK
jgi:hypothetical protein